MPLIDNGLYKMDDFNFESVREGGENEKKCKTNWKGKKEKIQCEPNGERGVGVEPVAEIPDWMVIRCLSDGSQERGN